MANPISLGTRFAVSLFALAFALMFTGGGIIGGILPLQQQASNWWAARSYLPVQAAIESVNLERHNSRKGGATYQAHASFGYQFNGRDYHGGRASFSAGSDNVGDYQQNLFAQLRTASEQHRQVTLWVDPRDPTSSVFDRSIRWQMSLMHLPFAVLFTAVGLGAWAVLIGVWRVGRGKTLAASLAAGKPLQFRPQKGAVWWLFGFAFFWNFLSWPIGLLALDDFVSGKSGAAIVVMIFPAVGLGCIYASWRLWNKQRPAGKPLIAITGIAPLRGKVHFQPAPNAVQTVQLEARLVQEAPRTSKAKPAVLWRQGIFNTSIGSGTSSVDFHVTTPPEQSQSSLHLLLTIAGVELTFELPRTT
jgi:hypothetical protein